MLNAVHLVQDDAWRQSFDSHTQTLHFKLLTVTAGEERMRIHAQICFKTLLRQAQMSSLFSFSVDPSYARSACIYPRLSAWFTFHPLALCSVICVLVGVHISAKQLLGYFADEHFQLTYYVLVGCMLQSVPRFCISFWQILHRYSLHIRYLSRFLDC